MTFKLPSAIRLVALLATVITATLLATAIHAQPVQLLKDLKPGMVPGDQRHLVQLVSTSETVYMVSLKYGTSDPFDTTFFLNSTNGFDSEDHPGFNMGRTDEFASAQFVRNYPLFAVKDGNAIFPNARWEHCYFEYDGVTRETTQLTTERSFHPPAATWIGAEGSICFFRRSHQQPNAYEIGYLDTESSTGLRVTRILPFSNETYGPNTGEAQVVGERLIISIFENDSDRMSVWGTDGTYDGTEELLALTSLDGVFFNSMYSGLGRCFIAAENRLNSPMILWVSDGTSSGTSKLHSSLEGTFPGGRPELFAESSSTIYWRQDMWSPTIHFTDGSSTGTLTYDGEHHDELRIGTITWLNDRLYISTERRYGGPAPGPWLVSDGFTTPTEVENVQIPFNAIFATANTTSGTFLYTGNPANPQDIYYVEDDIEQATLVAHGNGGHTADPPLVAFQGRPVYSQDDPTTYSDQLWTSNPFDPYQPHQITRFTQIPADSNPGQFEVASNMVYFRNTNTPNIWDPEIYKTDGTAGGSGEISLHNPVWLGEVPGGMLFYDNTRDPFTGEIWSHSNVYFYNGTNFDWTRYIQPTMGEPPAEPVRLFTIGNKCFFGGNYDHVPRLFASDGDLPGHSEISNFWETELEAPLHPIGVAGNRGLFYARTTNTATITYEIWSTDGTDTGTTKIAESLTPPTPGAAVAGGKIVFGASVDGVGIELMISDGSAVGTSMLKDIVMGDFSSRPRHFVNSGGKAFFIADTLVTLYIPGYPAPGLWVSDGSEAGTMRLRPLATLVTENDSLDLVGTNGGGIYLSGTASGNARILYSNGTSQASIIATLPLDAQPQLLGDVNGYMYIAMTTPELGRELYRTVGHTGGLELVEDFAPGPDSGAVMTDAAVFGNKLIFAANPHDGLTGTELHYIEVLDSNVDDWQIY